MLTAALALLLAAGLDIRGVVFADQDGDGARDAGEAGLAGVVVTDGTRLTRTGPEGAYSLAGVTARHVFVVTPGDRSLQDWYRPARARVDFPLAPAPVPSRWRFAHLSDPHVGPGGGARFRSALEEARGRGVLFAVVSGDLVENAPRADEAASRDLFAAYARGVRSAGLPVRPALGNHDLSGVDRLSARAAVGRRPDWGKARYEMEQGPRYSAFHRGKVHFIVLDTVGLQDQRYFGHLDGAQLEWIRRELAHVPHGTPVVTVGHIPLRSGALALGYAAEALARMVLREDARSSRRHVVGNADRLAGILRPYRWTLALQGHTHVAERLPAAEGTATRFHTAPSVSSRAEDAQGAGFFVYTVTGGAVDDGEPVLLSPSPQGPGE